MSKSSLPMPVPSAVISVPTSADDSILSKRALSTFRILPLSGRIACVRRSRPCLAEPPAESPSTMKIRSEEHTSELQSLRHLVCRLLLEKKKPAPLDPPAHRYPPPPADDPPPAAL